MTEKEFQNILKRVDNCHADALWELAECYEYGMYVERDYDQAFVLYKKAAEEGLTSAIEKVKSLS